MTLSTLSFCLAYNGDIKDAKEILKKSLIYNNIYKKYIEFVICDFSRNNDLYEWIIKNCSEELKIGYLKYFRKDNLVRWHGSIAKNITVSNASKDIIIIVDNGVLIDLKSTIQVMKSFFENNRTVVHIQSAQEITYYGYLAVPKEYFTLVGGFDESFEPVGYQEADLLERLNRLGLNINSYQQKDIDNYSFKLTLNTFGYTSVEYNRMLMSNYKKSRNKILNGFIISKINNNLM